MAKARKKENDANTESVLQLLRAKRAHLSPVQRGKRLAELVERGYSRRELARALNVSEGTVRYCLKQVKLAENTASLAIEVDRSVISENHQSIKHDQQSKLVGEPTGSFQDCRQERNKGTRLASSRQRQATFSQEPPARAAIDTGNTPGCDAELGGKLIADQVRRELPSGYRGQFIREIKNAPDTIRKVEFQAQAPLPGEIFTNRDPDEVIRACRPEEPEMTSMVSWLNFCFLWVSRWIQRLFPDRQTRQAAILAAEAILSGEDLCFTYRI
jgi:hypothetical protein